MVQPGARERVSPRLVGRDDALALARRRWDAALAGRGHLLLVAGEAGIGKTRLLREVEAVVDGSVVWAGAFPRDAEAAGGLVLGIHDGLRRAGIESGLRERLLGADTDGDAARRRRVLVGDLADLMVAAISGAPTLMMIEDLHWADELSLEVLERVASVLSSAPAMLVATYRTDELYSGTDLGRWRARLLERRWAEEVRLGRLAADETAAVVEAITGAIPSAEFVASLQRRSDGIPLHIEELLAGESLSAVPDTVAESVTARAAEFEPEVRDVLAASSIIGRSFDVDLLGAVVSSTPDAVDSALAALVDSHLLTALEEPGTFVFRHALICDAVYASVPPLRKRALHAAVAAAAESAGFGDAFVSEHFERASERDGAYRRSVAGAAQAVRVSAHREAVELYRRAVRMLPNDVSNADRADLHARLAAELAAIDENGESADNYIAAIALYRELGDVASAAVLVQDLMAAQHLLGASLDDRVELALDALDWLEDLDPETTRCTRSELFGALSAAYMLDRRLDEAVEYGRRSTELNDGTFSHIDQTLGSVLVFAGRGDEGWRMLENSIRAVEEAGREADAARGYRMLGTSASMLVEYDRADTWISAGLEYTLRAERLNDHHYLTAHRAHVRWARGEWDAAAQLAQRALVDGRGITTRIMALTVLGYVALGRGEFAAAGEFLGEALELAEPMGELQRVSPALWGLAELALRSGDPESAIDLCERAWARSSAVMDAAYLFPFVVTGTRALLAVHEPRLAREWLTRCTGLLRHRNIPGTLPALAHAEGLIELAEGRTGNARGLLEDASAQWQSLDRFWEATQALVDLASCAMRSRRPRDAVALVATAREQAESAGSVVLVRLAEAVTTSTDSGPLSARELEVARLVAAGNTNREIAEALVISPKTASAHVEHILAKLGVARRAEIAAWVSRI